MDDDRTWCPHYLDESAERFMGRVEVGSDCWLWTGPPTAKGYGMAQMVGAKVGTTAHRVSYMLSTGRPIPRGMVVRHECDTPACVAPAHLTLGTPGDNSRDMALRGRARNGPTGPLPGNASTVRKRLPAAEPDEHGDLRRRLYGA